MAFINDDGETGRIRRITTECNFACAYLAFKGFHTRLTMRQRGTKPICTLRDLFWRSGCCSKVKSTLISPKDVEDNYYLPQSLCDYTEPAKKRINPYKHVVKDLLPKKKFNSLYFRCATCLVIAQEINKTVANITVGVTDPKIEIQVVEKTLKLVCENFNLQHYKENNAVVQAANPASSILRSLDNQRLSRLRTICSLYVENVNMPTLYNIILKKNADITNYFCRSDGVFRDCFNFNFKAPSEEDEDDQNQQCVFKVLYTL